MKIYDMDNKCYVPIQRVKNRSTKVEQLSDALYCFENDIFDVIYDKSQPSLDKYVKEQDQSIINQKGMQYLFFTSGTTGRPTGVYKTKQNLQEESFSLIKVLGDRKFNRVVSTVPFVHIYGIDIGAILPRNLDIDIWIKENFLPEELAIEAQKEHTLIVTTPVFIKALNRIKKDVKFTNSLFLTSTAPLPIDDAKEFKQHYDCSVIQLFASTETGLMAYKTDDETILKPFDGVTIGSNEGMLNISSPFVAPKILNENLQDVVLPFQTEDIVEILNENEFKLLGRSSNLAKISGKRISTQQIENIIEELDDIDCVLIKIRRDDKALKDEILDIYVESKKELSAKRLRELLKQHYGSMNIAFKIYNNVKIKKSSVGKKIGFEVI
jgi:acyl-coenzyme A synthetase/AMP-(fatty) acid ligase